MPKSNEYWRKREQTHIKKMIKGDKVIAKKLAANQKVAMNDIQLQIDAFYGRFATTEGITMAEARKRVGRLDIDAYAVKAKRYVKGAHSGNETVKAMSFTQRANEEMRIYNVTMKINRLELLKANINLELVAMSSAEERLLLESFAKSARAEYERQAGILGRTLNYNEKSLTSIVNSSFLTATWSDRLWNNQDALRSEINKLLNRGIVQGQNPRKLARELQKKFDASISNSERLMRTEMAVVQTEVQKDSFFQLEIDSYEYIAEPTACDVCAKLDGKIFKLEDMEIGMNAPVMHPHCMCSTAAAMNREEWEADLTRRGL